ncbi:hypothetical protein SNE40_004010 [Patella caerulea]|uniref:Uncharacterized protein n=1 Tax=Patella caerulea TaxID=87958 RepID=A0AAN8K971_PATCE
MEKKGMFFTTLNISDGSDALSVLVNTLYNLLPHLRKFSEVKIPIPEFILENLISDRNELSQIYNQPEKSKHVHKQLNREILDSYCNKLYELALVPFMRLPRFQELRQAVEKFAESVG